MLSPQRNSRNFTKLKQNAKSSNANFLFSSQTTQVPQFILADAAKHGKTCNILVSQPRKIAAITIATRVASELNVELGETVGFQVALHKKMETKPNESRLLFCTTGVILQKLIQEKSMAAYTHIILDEGKCRDVRVL